MPLQKQAIKSLKRDESIVIAKADKVNVVVVIYKTDYQTKIDEHLSHKNIYSILINNPEKQLQNRLKKAFKN